MQKTTTGDRRTVGKFLCAIAKANQRALSRRFDPGNVTDRVVRTLLDKGLVRVAEVRPVFDVWIAQTEEGAPGRRLWRMLAQALPKKAEQIRGVAASVYAFDEAIVSTSDGLQFIEDVWSNWSVEQWAELRRAKCLPIRIESSSVADEKDRYIFVSHDPTRVDLQPMIRGLGVEDYELRYSPEEIVTNIGDRIKEFVAESDQKSFDAVSALDQSQAA